MECSDGPVVAQIKPSFASVSAISAENCCSKAVVLPEPLMAVVVDADQTIAKLLVSKRLVSAPTFSCTVIVGGEWKLLAHMPS